MIQVGFDRFERNVRERRVRFAMLCGGDLAFDSSQLWSQASVDESLNSLERVFGAGELLGRSVVLAHRCREHFGVANMKSGFKEIGLGGIRGIKNFPLGAVGFQ